MFKYKFDFINTEMYNKFKELENNIVQSDSFLEYCRINFLISIFGEIPTTFPVYKVNNKIVFT